MRKGLGFADKSSARVVETKEIEARREWATPAVVAGVIRGNLQAQRAFLAPFTDEEFSKIPPWSSSAEAPHPSPQRRRPLPARAGRGEERV